MASEAGLHVPHLDTRRCCIMRAGGAARASSVHAEDGVRRATHGSHPRGRDRENSRRLGETGTEPRPKGADGAMLDTTVTSVLRTSAQSEVPRRGGQLRVRTEKNDTGRQHLFYIHESWLPAHPIAPLPPPPPFFPILALSRCKPVPPDVWQESLAGSRRNPHRRVRAVHACRYIPLVLRYLVATLFL